MSLSEILFSQNWILSLIFILLIVISISSWYIIFNKILFFKAENKSIKTKDKTLTSELINQLFNIYSDSDLDQEKKDRKSDILIEKAKRKITFGHNYLASVANLTPFIGLFGTVLGVYFALIDISEQGNASLNTVSRPIGEALIATAIGLWCAIPASFAFNYFSKSASDLLKDIKIEVESLLIK